MKYLQIFCLIGTTLIPFEDTNNQHKNIFNEGKDNNTPQFEKGLPPVFVDHDQSNGMGTVMLMCFTHMW